MEVPDGRPPVIKKCLFPLFSPKNNIKHSSSVRVLPVVSSPMVHAVLHYPTHLLPLCHPSNIACFNSIGQHCFNVWFLSLVFLVVSWVNESINQLDPSIREKKSSHFEEKHALDCNRFKRMDLTGHFCASDHSPVISAMALTACLCLWAEDGRERSGFSWAHTVSGVCVLVFTKLYCLPASCRGIWSISLCAPKPVTLLQSKDHKVMVELRWYLLNIKATTFWHVKLAASSVAVVVQHETGVWGSFFPLRFYL